MMKKANLDVDLLRGVVPISYGAAHLAQLLIQAQRTARPVVLTQKGCPTGVILSVPVFEALRRAAALADRDALLAGFVPDAPDIGADELAAFLALDEPEA